MDRYIFYLFMTFLQYGLIAYTIPDAYFNVIINYYNQNMKKNDVNGEKYMKIIKCFKRENSIRTISNKIIFSLIWPISLPMCLYVLYSIDKINVPIICAYYIFRNNKIQ